MGGDQITPADLDAIQIQLVGDGIEQTLAYERGLEIDRVRGRFRKVSYWSAGYAPRPDRMERDMDPVASPR